MASRRKPEVAVAVIVINSKNEILTGIRMSSPGKGKHQFPGGHQRFREFLLDAAQRELFEETGLRCGRKFDDVSPLTQLCTLDEPFKNSHFVTVYYYCYLINGTIINKEPKKNYDWYWRTKDELCNLPMVCDCDIAFHMIYRIPNYRINRIKRMSKEPKWLLNRRA